MALLFFPYLYDYFFLGGGGVEKRIERGETATGFNFFTRCNGNDPMNLHGSNF